MAAKVPMVLVSGPTGVGKGAIERALALYEKLHLVSFTRRRVILYTTRRPRPGEQEGREYWYAGIPTDPSVPDAAARDEHKAHLRALVAGETSAPTPDGLVTCQVRTDWQAIWLQDVLAAGRGLPGTVVFLEVYFRFPSRLKEALLRTPLGARLSILSIFVAPMTEIDLQKRAAEEGLEPAELLRAEMRDRIQQRIRAGLSLESQAEVERRIATAPEEMEASRGYDVVVVNPYGEGHPAWGGPNVLPMDGARDVVDTIARLIEAHVRACA